MITDPQSNGFDRVDTFDIRTSLRSIGDAVRHHKWLVIGTCLFTLGLVTVYILVWPPIYRAEATLMAEKDVDASRDAFYLNWSVFRKDDAPTEIELMRAGNVLKEVIRQERLTYDDVYHPFFSNLGHLWQDSWPGRKYEDLKDWLTGNHRETGVSKADAMLAKTVTDMAAGISVEPVGETNVGKFTVRGPTNRVASVTNTLLRVYLEQRDQRHQTEARNSYEVLTEELHQAGVELDDMAARRLDYARANNVTFDFQKETLEVGKLAELETDIASARAKIANLDATVHAFAQELNVLPDSLTTLRVFQGNVQHEKLKERRLDLETQMLHMRDVYREDSPEVQELKQDIAKTDALMATQSDRVESSRTESMNELRQDLNSKRATLTAELAGQRASLAVMEATAAAMRWRLAKLTTMQTEMKALERQFAVANEKYQLLMGKQAQAALSGTSAKAVMPSVRVVEYATTPSSKSWPSLKILYPSALGIGLLLGMAMAVVKSYASGRVRREYVDRLRGSLPLYGHISVPTTGPPISVMASGPANGHPNGSSQN